MVPLPCISRLAVLGPLALAAAVAAITAPAAAQSTDTAPGTTPPPIAIDGAFDDWRDQDPLLVDPRDAPGSEVDIRAIRGRADARHLHLQFEVVDVASLQGLERPLELLLDVDGDPGTGADVELLPGLDLIVVFSPTDPRRADRPGQAVGLEIFGVNPREAPNAYAVDLHFAPSHASDRFEIRLERGSDLPGVGAILTGSRVTGRLVQRAADGSLLEVTDPFTVDMPRYDAAPPAPDLPPSADPLARSAGNQLRIMSWNAERGVMVRKAGATGRLIAATTPDIVLLQEFTEDTPATGLQRILESATGEDWSVHVGRGGGNLRSVVATRLPASVVTDLDPLPLPNVPNRDIRTAAQLIEHPGGRVLALSIHLKCCGRPGDSSDRRRIDEANAVRDAMARVIADVEPDAVIIAGDLNLVGTRTPLEILLQGLDVDGSELLTVDARQPAPAAANATWWDEDSPFTPGRLDFVLVSDRSLRPTKALVLNGRYMADEPWTRGGLRPDDTLISDHFPILVDLAWGRGE